VAEESSAPAATPAAAADAAAPRIVAARVAGGALRLRVSEAGRLQLRLVRIGARGHRVFTRVFNVREGANTIRLTATTALSERGGRRDEQQHGR